MDNMQRDEYEYLEVPIKDIEELLNTHIVEVDSPDGWVTVSEFIHKHDSLEHVMLCDGNEIKCSGGHRFESDSGWIEASEWVDGTNVLTRDGYKPANVENTGNVIPIVDIVVDHPNHRYYTENVSSHNTGKSLALCHLAASYLKQHKNVLYITMEMAEEKIAERIDANMLRVPVNSLEEMEKDEYINKFKRVKDTIKGKLIIKEYPTSGASAATFKALLKELQIKKKFKPDVIMIDYLGICASSRFSGSSENSYHYVKSIAEEIRALGIEHDVPIWTAAQVNRGAFNDTDPDMTATAESFGLPAVADMMVAVVSSEELREMSQLKFSVIKNRYSDYKKSFMVNVDYPRMTLSNVSDDVKLSAPVQADISKKPQFGKKRGEKKFDGIKVN